MYFLGLFKSSTAYSVNDANKILDMLFNQSTYDKRVLPDYPVTVRAQYNLHFVSSLVSIFSFCFRLSSMLTLTFLYVNHANQTPNKLI